MEEQKRIRGLDDLEGEIISGRYQIVRRIGKGGMGVVYLATQTNLGRNVCIKVLNPALLDDEDAVGRFEREAKGLSRLQHPNIVTIFDYGRDGNLAYIVMEYAQGETLSKYLKAHGALTLDQFLPLAVQTLKGIGEAHKLGLIHRDIKPANIVLCELEGEKNYVKILDFGLAKLAQGGEELTKEQQLVGSASYMSPEQIISGISDTRTDVYALGVMFYLMLSGRKPFTGSNDNVILYKHVNEAPTPLKRLIDPQQGVPDALCEVIDQCLNKAPEKRPQNANDLLNALSYALDAPQLRAGFSSMSLASVEMPKSEPALIPVPKEETQPQPQETPAQETQETTEAKTTEDNDSSMPSHPQSAYQVSTETKDRKILILTLSCVAAIIAIILVVILNKTTEPQPEPKLTIQAQTEDQDEPKADDANAPDSQDTDNTDNTDGDMPNPDTPAPEADSDSSRLTEEEREDLDALIRDANAAIQSGNQEEVNRLCAKIRAIDPTNEQAIPCPSEEPDMNDGFNFEDDPEPEPERAAAPTAKPAKPKPRPTKSDSKSDSLEKTNHPNKSGSRAKLLGV
ncbi:MAG: serine/threonine protein kinase [Proteobacteria bacterium]|nr:serine/threonine protein kinase [Pseudomonadota bacterium]